jgi:hypothetical protein
VILLGGEVAVGDLVGEGEVAQPSSSAGDASLLVLEVREQVFLERVERVGDGAAGVVAVVSGQRSRGCFDMFEIVGDRPMLGSERSTTGRIAGFASSSSSKKSVASA